MAKEHADLSPSSAGRWMKCAGSVVLSQGIEDKGSEYTLEGTAAHDVAAMCLTSGTDAAAYVGRLIDAKGTEVPVTEDMAENVQVYVDAVRQRVKAYEMAGAQVTLEVEQRVAPDGLRDVEHAAQAVFGHGRKAVGHGMRSQFTQGGVAGDEFVQLVHHDVLRGERDRLRRLTHDVVPRQGRRIERRVRDARYGDQRELCVRGGRARGASPSRPAAAPSARSRRRSGPTTR